MNRNIIAILRGVKPKEVLDIAHVIVKAGISQVEVPLNSPSAFESIELLRDEFEGSIQFGAGTVTDIKQVEVLAKIGVNFIVSKNKLTLDNSYALLFYLLVISFFISCVDLTSILWTFSGVFKVTGPETN